MPREETLSPCSRSAATNSRMLSLAAARSAVAQHVVPLGPIPTSLEHALGRVLRSSIAAPEDFPAFDRSAMDGYAIAADDSSERFEIIGEVKAGDLPALTISPGKCARIFTGAALPPGASQVIMQEDVVREGGFIVPQRRGSTTHVRRRGEDAREGDVLLRPGTRLFAPELSLLAQIGHVAPHLSPAPRVVHIAAGDELVAPGGKPGPGQIRDSNSTLVASMLAEAGARIAHQSRCGDDIGEFVREVHSLPDTAWDLLLISGGASVGDYDFGPAALARIGFTTHFHGINLRPGKPLLFATRGRHAAFVIPGNPVSHLACFHAVIRAALECMEGATPSWPIASIPLAKELPAASGPRDILWPARSFVADGQLLVQPLPWQSSGDLCGLASANALIEILPGTPAQPAGTLVKTLLLALR